MIVYDYKNQQIYRELKTRTEHIERPTSLHLMKGDKLLAICDEEVVSILNIEKSTVEKHTNDNKQVTRLFKLPLSDENSGVAAFAGATSSGLLKIWNEVYLDSSNNLTREDMDPYRIDCLKILKSSGISSGSTSGGSGGQITDMITLPNGAIVACNADKSITLYEEKPGNAACGACCNIF